jgi:hypothetical protein
LIARFPPCPIRLAPVIVDLSTEEQKIMIATQAATQGAILGTTITKAAWHAKPSWFVIASKDRAILPEQEIWARRH